MTRQEILQFCNENPVFFLATVEGDLPKVCGMMLLRADDEGILFSSGTTKEIHKQLMPCYS